MGVSKTQTTDLENADLENADLANKDLENTDVSQTQKQPLLASVMNSSPLVRLFFFFSRSAFSIHPSSNASTSYMMTHRW